ncbi:hypothetical protein A3A70_02515 [candidate division WWE3 bacterium RIFCSPLOWO2_01_FULL_42_11]|uniref:ArnT-like N-terminal domain-containing protein n=1 Tax=candidate division WWE3 bacterium RIFCSPLOWO2_01_FULL_42_11 TaxID=1802627 RepID=A0A1F4VQ23_UNCKA|nr:MAG: hypothetical protein A3A70_02515 [candidate division WWE3 bacterium RIFCSPLOWO2_01_FULL_42_11]
MKFWEFLRKRERGVFIVFALALSLRLIGSGLEGINPDEYRWHDRTNTFMHVLEKGDLSKTMIAGHPGATIVWQSLIALKVGRALFRVFDPSFDIQNYPYLTETFERVHFIYQFPIILISSLFIAFAYWALKKLISDRYALIAVSLLLTDQYYLAHSRVVQMDAVQTAYVMVALLSAFLYRLERKKVYLILAAVMIAFDAMTKIYGLAVLPLVWGVIVYDDLSMFLRRNRLKSFLKILSLTFWMALIITIVSIILLPSWFFDFNGTVAIFKRAIFVEGVEGIWEGWEYFFGKLYLNGEPRWFYLVALFLRQNLISFIFLPISLLLLMRRKITDLKLRNLMLVLLFLGIYWGVILSIPTKKEDRYILLTHVCLDFVAAGGIWWVLEKVKSKLKVKIFLVLTILVFLATSLPLKGQYLGYFNPLLGGPRTTVKLMRLGWGEGMTGAARFINSQDDPENAKTVAWYESNISPYCFCEVLPTYAYMDKGVVYDVFYVNQLQRLKETTWIDKFFKEENIIHVEYINGFPYTWVVERPKK